MYERLKQVRRLANRDRVQAAILCLFFFPLFFQLSGRLFRSEEFFRSEGKLLQLPLPIASVFCFVGIAVLLRLDRRNFQMGFVFSLFIAMMFSTIISSTKAEDLELARFILLIQFILPVFALVLGSLYLAPKNPGLSFESILLYVLLLVIPLEVVSTIVQGDVHLASYLYLFSLYQHLQYMPVVFTAFYLLTLATFYDSPTMRKGLVFLAPWMGIYLAASLAMTAILLTVAGMIVYLGLSVKHKQFGQAIVIISLLAISFAAYFNLAEQAGYYAYKFGRDIEISQLNLAAYQEIRSAYLSSIEGTFIEHLPRNLKERILYWWVFGAGLFDSAEVFLFGHPVRLDRSIFPSAHNYYLDLAYNFGTVALLPFVVLIGSTASRFYRAARTGNLGPGLIMLAFLVAFFVIVDNSLKVAFRQPYPGMIMFFLWGVLLSRLPESKAESGQDS